MKPRLDEAVGLARLYRLDFRDPYFNLAAGRSTWQGGPINREGPC